MIKHTVPFVLKSLKKETYVCGYFDLSDRFRYTAVQIKINETTFL
ncbi:hypothetical protein AB4X15_23605 [Peribacillus simplex]|nr:hypothetical protein [Brevibacillus sp. JNUCC-41]